MEEIKFEKGRISRIAKKASEDIRFWPKHQRIAGRDWVNQFYREIEGSGAGDYDQDDCKVPSSYIFRIAKSRGKDKKYLAILKNNGYNILHVKDNNGKTRLEHQVKIDDDIEKEVLRKLKKAGYEVYRNLTALLDDSL